MARRDTSVGFGVHLTFDTEDYATGVRKAKQINRGLVRDVGKIEEAQRKYQRRLTELKARLKQGIITKEQYSKVLIKYRAQLRRANGEEDKRTAAMQRRIAREREAARQTREVNRLERERQRELQRTAAAEASAANAARLRQRQMVLAGGSMGAGMLSSMGMGGAAAGASRGLAAGALLGGSVGGMALTAGGAALVMGGYQAMRSSYDAFSSLESKLIDLKVLFGKVKGEKLGEEFKNLAANTALTTDQLVTNAKTWASYGLTADGIVDRMRMLGTVAGGNTEKFHALTVAFAQVNAQGKLMGQEKNQLINAGFSLSEVAKVAGVEMRDFAKAMEEGAITAEHVNQALENMTGKGGLFAGLLEEKAKTLEGQATIAKSAWAEAWQEMGKRQSGFFAALIKGWKSAGVAVREYNRYKNEGSIRVLGGDLYGAKGAGSYSMSGKVIESGTFSPTQTVKEAPEGDFLEPIAKHTRMKSDRRQQARFSRELEMKRQMAIRGFSREEMYGMPDEAYDTAERAFNERMERQERERNKAAIERGERIKREEKFWNERRSRQVENLASIKENYRYMDRSSGGYNKEEHRISNLRLVDMYRKGELAYDDLRDAIRLSNEYFQHKKSITQKEEYRKRQEDVKNEIEGIITNLFPQEKYSNLSPAARAVMQQRDKEIEALSDKGRVGKAGGMAGAGAEYALMASRRQEAQSVAEERNHRAVMESQTKQINIKAKKQIIQLRRNNNLLATKLGGAV
jgi:tape measure domain-containing protein